MIRDFTISSLFIAFLAILLIGLEVSLLSGCAQIQRPTGGPRDTIPPQLDTMNSTRNLQTRFQKQRIELTFTEFLRLNDVFNQVVVSPPLSKRPEITLHKYRTVYFEFPEDEELRPDATYTINFGEAIQDFTEGNSAPIRFVFSTGDYIDSLRLRGTIVDARTDEPVPDVLLMLYDNLADSVVRSERPFYFARTDKSGNFLIENVKSDTFKVFALEDANLNYLFDQKNERIGFLDTAIVLNDSLSPFLSVRFFQEELPLQIIDDEATHYGLFKLVFNREPRGALLRPLRKPADYFQEQEKDTIRIWYHQDSTYNWSVEVKMDTLLDTVQVVVKNRTEYLDKTNLYQQNLVGEGRTNQVNPFQPLEIQFNHPLRNLDTSLISLLRDTTRTPVKFRLEIDSANKRTLLLKHSWKSQAPYALQLLPGALTDMYGLQNDTIDLALKVNDPEEYGAIDLTLNELDSTLSYVVHVQFKQKTIATFLVDEQSSFSTKLEALSPGSYQLEIIEDRNENERWDTGNYDLKQQPERIFVKELEPLRANWEVEAIVSIQSE